MSIKDVVTVAEAKERTAEFFGFTAAVSIQLDNGKVFEIPNPSLLDDDQLERWEELQFLLEQCDRKPDTVVPETTLTDEDGKTITVPARTVAGDHKTPYRINGELLTPNYNVRLATVLFGEQGYAEYKAGGGLSSQISLEWAKMNQEFRDHQADAA